MRDFRDTSYTCLYIQTIIQLTCFSFVAMARSFCRFARVKGAFIGPRGNSIHLPLVGGNSRRRNVVPQTGTELAYYCLHNVYVTSHTYTWSRCTCIGTDRQSEPQDSHLVELYPNST